jgi:hypothetical protein
LPKKTELPGFVKQRAKGKFIEQKNIEDVSIEQKMRNTINKLVRVES